MSAKEFPNFSIKEEGFFHLAKARNIMSKRRLLSLLLAVTLLLGLGACFLQEEGVSEETPPPIPPDPLAPKPISLHDGLPDYLDVITDADRAMDCTGTLKRTDVGLEISVAPYLARRFASVLVDMQLAPRREGDGKLAVEKPFTLTLTYQGGTDVFVFEASGVTVNGAEYFPQNPSWLDKLYEDDVERFLTGDLFPMGQLMDFTPDQVASVELRKDENYSDGVTTLTLTGREEIASLMEALKSSPMRRFEADEASGMFARAGGGISTCTFTLEDGSAWSLVRGSMDTIKTPAVEETFFVFELDYEATFGRINQATGIPAMKAEVGTLTPKVYDKAYAFESRTKTMTHLIPVDMFYDAEPVLRPGGTAAASLSFADEKGDAVSPVSLEATLYREQEGFQETDDGAPLALSGTGLTLPTDQGKYFVIVKAAFEGGSAEYVFSYRVSLFPWYFDDISFGNDAGNVTLIRDDVGVEMTGGQNRQYVNFILGLELTPTAGRRQTLPVKKPFTLRFELEGEQAEFSFNNQSITYGGRDYFAENPGQIAALYNTLSEETMMNDNLIDHGLRGFLTKDVAGFVDTFRFQAENAAKIEITREKPEDYTVYDVTGALKEQDFDIFDYIVLGRERKESDYYYPRRFYYSFKLTMKDGTEYQIGETVLVDGKESGWYTIQSDSPKLEGLVEGLRGEEHKRQKPIRGGITMHDDGTVTFS